MNKIKEIINETKRIQFYYQNQSRKFAKNKLLEKGYKMKNIRRAFKDMRERHRLALLQKAAVLFAITLIGLGLLI